MGTSSSIYEFLKPTIEDYGHVDKVITFLFLYQEDHKLSLDELAKKYGTDLAKVSHEGAPPQLKL